MNRICVCLIIFSIVTLNTKAQSDKCVNFVTTNPDNPLNNGCKQNTNEQGNPRFFDWRGNVNFPVNMVDRQTFTQVIAELD